MFGTRPWVSAATALRRVCGAAALLGLFWMHGLAVHGTTHASHGGDPTPAAPAVASHDNAAHRGAAGAAGSAAAGARDVVPPVGSLEPAPDRDLAGIAGLCLAILLAGVAVGAFLSRWPRRRRGPALVTLGGWPARSRRDRDPPCLLTLSIQRC